ncbi:MAG: efflux RND transporter periplasmic adaptor subunit [Planctomycetes bacterium]|nr:efflux RND transporter periplasmic adaptor subunit [Planctomycetota bacterium]
MQTMHFFIMLLTLSAALFAGGCSEPPPEPKPPGRPVKIHVIGSLQPEATVEYPGTIRAHQTAEMGFEVAGRVIAFLVQEGDRVEKDAVLARLDPRDYQAELKVAQANLEKARADLKRSENIFKEDPGAISADEIERDRRALKVAQARLEIAQKAVSDTELRAPFAGVVARKLVDDFANVVAKQPVLILQDLSSLEIEVAVPERDFVRGKADSETKEQVTKRLNPQVIVSALPDRTFPAVIKEYAMTADPITRTFAVKLTFENPKDVNILPGMTARVRVVVDPESAWSVPAWAVQADENKQPYVWKVDPKTMKVAKCPVELGPLAKNRVLLKKGVKKGDMIAISGVALLREGMQVRKYEP